MPMRKPVQGLNTSARNNTTRRERRGQLQIPKFSGRTHKLKQKLCTICGREFMGDPISKYCPVCRAGKIPRKRKKYDPIELNNQMIRLSGCIALKSFMKCQLPGCSREFEVLLTPRIKVYPKYCERHRTEHQRKFFSKSIDRREQGGCGGNQN